ncbi:MAG: hypothetical protein J3K34DRAFT_406117 [Monoraphidium minutum]|nr:MAG: hypothetical protein J3K34DRAFT_406117 [Monoraphidium minutum]
MATKACARARGRKQGTRAARRRGALGRPQHHADFYQTLKEQSNQSQLGGGGRGRDAGAAAHVRRPRGCVGAIRGVHNVTPVHAHDSTGQGSSGGVQRGATEPNGKGAPKRIQSKRASGSGARERRRRRAAAHARAHARARGRGGSVVGEG